MFESVIYCADCGTGVREEAASNHDTCPKCGCEKCIPTGSIGSPNITFDSKPEERWVDFRIFNLKSAAHILPSGDRVFGWLTGPLKVRENDDRELECAWCREPLNAVDKRWFGKAILESTQVGKADGETRFYPSKDYAWIWKFKCPVCEKHVLLLEHTYHEIDLEALKEEYVSTNIMSDESFERSLEYVTGDISGSLEDINADRGLFTRLKGWLA